MIITCPSHYIASTKPFFMPWQETKINYDALLGLSFTLNTHTKGNIYLSTYIKTPRRLIIGFDLHQIQSNGSTKIIPIVREDITIQKGISIIHPTIKSEYIVDCTVTIIDTNAQETYYGDPIQISPRYINYTTNKTNSNNYLTIRTGNKDSIINLTYCTITAQDLDISVNNNTLNITDDNSYNRPKIINNINGIQFINDHKSINGVITIPVENTFLENLLYKINDSKSCINVKLPSARLCNIDDIYYSHFDPRHSKNEAPVDVCFTSPGLIFKPERINNIKFTHKNLDWHVLT